MNMKENLEGIHGQFKRCSVLTDTESHYSGSSERLIIPITEEGINVNLITRDEMFKKYGRGLLNDAR